METIKLDYARVREQVQAEFDRDQAACLAKMRTLQTVVYVMVGGAYLARFAAEQPGYFYIDSRVGKLPYSKRAITQAVNVLKIYADVCGVCAEHMPAMPDFHNCGVF